MLNLWMVAKYLRARRRLLSPGSALTIVGMAIGVASMVVAMAVVSGYETTLRRSVIDIVGHILVLKRGMLLADSPKMLEDVSKHVRGFVAGTPFVVAEAALAHNKKLNGIVVQGMEPSSVDKVLRLRSRLTEGKFELDDGEIPGALIGKGIRDRFGLKMGDVFQILVPSGSGLEAQRVRARVQKLRVNGVVHLGRHDFDTRYVVTDIRVAQKFAGLGDRYSGIRIRVQEDDQAAQGAWNVAQKMEGVETSSWIDFNPNLFQATKIEKAMIFFILLLMVVAASFNVASLLFVSVLQRYADVAILRTMGVSKRFVKNMFVLQGMVIGVTGTLLGFALGLAASFGFVFVQEKWGLISGEVYKLDRIDVELRGLDFILIFVAAQLICWVATLAPARRAARMLPTEGLRYE